MANRFKFGHGLDGIGGQGCFKKLFAQPVTGPGFFLKQFPFKNELGDSLYQPSCIANLFRYAKNADYAYHLLFKNNRQIDALQSPWENIELFRIDFNHHAGFYDIFGAFMESVKAVRVSGGDDDAVPVHDVDVAVD